jgi:D-lactate dehydrogenase
VNFADAEAISVFVYSRITAGVLDTLPRLRLIATRSTGFDHIDVAECKRRGIGVCNVPSYGSHTVAEHVFGLLLTISHRLGLRGFDLRGKTMGVVGTGEIGRCVIRIARGFGISVLAHDVAPDRDVARHHEVRYTDFDTLLRESDIISLHVPLSAQTRHMISDPQFAMMKRGAVLINTARGDIVDVRALLKALAEGKLAAAGLDVLSEEPAIREEAELLRSVFQRTHNLETLLADHVLLRMRNVFITPHSAFDTREAVQRILDTTVENIIAFIDRSPRNCIF